MGTSSSLQTYLYCSPKSSRVDRRCKDVHLCMHIGPFSSHPISFEASLTLTLTRTPGQ